MAQSNISYNASAGTITVKAGTGSNNVCLMLDYLNTDYKMKKEQKYLVVRGTNLAKGPGKSCLWWLNGQNKGSQVAPTKVVSAGKETLVAWDITKSGLNSNCQGDFWFASTGQTIFGLTSTTGTSVISYIGFVDSIDNVPTSIIGAHAAKAKPGKRVYNLNGIAMDGNAAAHGIYISGDKKAVR